MSHPKAYPKGYTSPPPFPLGHPLKCFILRMFHHKHQMFQWNCVNSVTEALNAILVSEPSTPCSKVTIISQTDKSLFQNKGLLRNAYNSCKSHGWQKTNLGNISKSRGCSTPSISQTMVSQVKMQGLKEYTQVFKLPPPCLQSKAPISKVMRSEFPALAIASMAGIINWPLL